MIEEHRAKKRFNLFLWIWLILIVILFGGTMIKTFNAEESTGSKSTITGTIKDSDGVVLSEVEVTIGDKSATTDTNGSYTISGLKPDTYSLSFSDSTGLELTTKELAETSEIEVSSGDNIANYTLVPLVSDNSQDNLESVE